MGTKGGKHGQISWRKSGTVKLRLPLIGSTDVVNGAASARTQCKSAAVSTKRYEHIADWISRDPDNIDFLERPVSGSQDQFVAKRGWNRNKRIVGKGYDRHRGVSFDSAGKFKCAALSQAGSACSAQPRRKDGQG